jgi:hypothetical protein
MTDQLYRRRILFSALSTSLLWLSGCGEPAGRGLNAVSLQPPVEQDGRIIIEMQANAYSKNLDESEAEFRNVAVVGYTSSQNIVGQEPLGTIKINEQPSVTLHCSEWPDFLTFTIDDYGCRYNTEISVWEVNSPDSEDAYYGFGDKNCNDPELPVNWPE